MATENQKRVISKTIENYGKGKKIVKRKILEESGYSKGTIPNPKIIYDSKGVQEELKPFIEKLEKERIRLINSISKEKLSEVDYKKKIDSVDVLTKNIQLLLGKETEKVKFTTETENLKDIIKQFRNDK